MALVLADLGADKVLDKYFNTGGDLTVKLYTNNYDPLQTSAVGSFTEASGGDYASKTLTAGSWVVTPANDPSDAIYVQQIWTFTGPLSGNATVYGYYVVDASGVEIFAEKLAASFTPANNGDQLKITPKFQMSSGTPS